MDTPPDQLAAFFSTLGDPNRLKIISLLHKQEHNIGEIAACLDIGEQTAAHHLAKLHEIGLINLRQSGNQRQYRLDAVALNRWKQHVQRIETFEFATGQGSSGDAWIDELDLDDFDRKVLRGYTSNGRLKEIPSKQKKALAVMRWLITKFEPEVRYTEPQVNEILTAYHEDYAQLRRGLIDLGLLQRERDGTSYWRA